MSRIIKKNWRIILVFALMGASAVCSVYLEWRDPFHTTKFAWYQGLAWYVSLILLSKANSKKLKQLLQPLGILFAFAFLAHILLTITNVISSPDQSWINTFKIYRFLSVSGFFWIYWSTWFAATIFLAPTLKPYYPNRKTFQLSNLLTHLLIYIGLVSGLVGFAQQYRDSLLAVVNLRTDFADRVAFRFGGNTYYGWIQPYTQFITQLTPKDSRILIPPQSNVWKMEGNADFVRYFLYPRQLVIFPNLFWTDFSQVPVRTQYILVAEGECGEGDCGWPKFFIPQSQILRSWEIKRPSGEITELPVMDFEPELWHHRWGLIELKPLASGSSKLKANHD